MKDLYYSNKSNKYYYMGVTPCSKCLKFVTDFLFIQKTYTRKHKTERYFCKTCINKIPRLPNIYESTILALVVDILPVDAFPVFDAPPVLSSPPGSPDCFLSAQPSKDGERVIDKTFQSRNRDFMIQNDAKKPNQIEALYDKDVKRSFTPEGIIEELKSYRDATVLLEHSEDAVKMLTLDKKKSKKA